MSYSGISIPETLEKINAASGGWFLPQVQRQYVWGARHASETYVCLLMDSLLRRYPIGAIVLWETSTEVPHREFLRDYSAVEHTKIVDAGRWGAAKSLVYDGQQRLQTLYSVLRHRFNGRILHYDVLFDPDHAEADETGFIFRDPTESDEARYVRMTELSSFPCEEKYKVRLENKCLPAAAGDADALCIKINVSRLWSVFVDTNHKAVAYFSVRSQNAEEVNEIFRRLNTGGVALTQLELILGRIKAKYFDFEERVWQLAESIKDRSGGLGLDAPYFLQLFHLVVKGTIRVDEKRISSGDVEAFDQLERTCAAALTESFGAYLKEIFNINNAALVPRWSAFLPIAIYLITLKQAGREWRIRTLDSKNLDAINRYFILSQLCDWNTQTMVNAFARETVSAAKAGSPFPFVQISRIAVTKNRTDQLHEYHLRGQPLFALKILMPHRSFVFHGNKPQLDHIFPIALAGGDDAYRAQVDTLWNLQLVPAGVNNYKRARDPKAFFESEEGSKYYASYDFIPALSSSLWDSPKDFIEGRRDAMKNALHEKYGIDLILQDGPSEVT